MRLDLSGLNFLIVGGETLATDDIAASIERRGGQARVAPSCSAAFEAIEQKTPDVVVIDWGMSDCDAVAAEMNSLDIPHVYLGSPNKRFRESVRRHNSDAFAETMMLIAASADIADETHLC